MSNAHARPSHDRSIALGLVLLLLAAVLVVLPATKAAAATMLLQEGFGGTSVADPAWQALDGACITRATAAPPTGSSNLGVCANRIQAPVSGTTPGFLQLTDNRTGLKGGAVFNRPVPSVAGLDVQFDQYQYQSLASLQGADGIAFFLTDGSRNLTAAGAPGGSLGYGQSTTTDGVNGGYLGIGLDVYGNFSSTDGGLGGTGCGASPAPPGRFGGRIVARGPGQDRTGYCYIQGSNVPNGLAGLRPILNVSTTGAPDATVGRTIRVTVSPASPPVVTVYYGARAGMSAAELSQAMQFTMPAAAPSTYKLGFTASTGGSSDTHLIRNVSVSSINDLDDITLVKQIDRTTTQPAAYSEGAVIPYQFVVTNGSIKATLSSIAVSDPKIATVSCASTTLAPLASTTCTGSHTVTAAEAVAGSLVNTATATATKTETISNVVTTTTVTSKTATVTAPIATPAPAVTLTKTALLTDTNGNAQADAGEQIRYSFLARNSGNVTLQNVAVADPKVSGITPASTQLAPGASATFTSAAYTVLQTDIDKNTAVTNTATVSGRTLAATPATVTATSTATTPIRYAPSISLTKNGTIPTGAGAGSTVSYSFTATNTGNTGLNSVAVSDPKSGLSALSYAWPGTAGRLEIGQSVTATASYTLTQADVDAGQVLNTATATGTPPTGSAVSATASRTVTIARTNDLALTKTANPAFISAAGTVVTYTFRATNTGTTTLTAVAISDPKSGLSALTYSWPGTSGRLLPGQVVTATAAYTTTAADVTAGTIANTATATATGPTGGAFTRTASVSISVIPDPAADAATVVQGGSVVIDVLANDGPAATGATFSRAQLSATPKAIGGAAAPAPATPVQGSVSCVASGATRGQCTYRPIAAFVGTDVFDYSLSGQYGTWNVRVTVTVTALNRAPVARPDRVVATTGGPAVTVAPLANDTDEDAGTTLALAGTSVPAGLRGSFSCSGSTCTYTPAADGWTGSATIAYTVSDGALTAGSTITVWVDPAPLVRRGFSGTGTTSGAVGIGAWTGSSVVATPVASCTAGRPSTLVSWSAAAGATGWTLERRLAGTTPGPWTVIAAPAASATSFTDDRVGEGRSYQWRVRPDLQRWLGVTSAASTAVAQPAVTTAGGC
ncbi:Ig-like domain-containing protein [Rathayibacter sp. VKM Ac-2801]|uniref:DUF7507 domain-containing protein n=1 Tax=Rathayibacter sp. VKM Ac-2801 TaxID=2609255 RepID=UPI0013200F37|nr:Ig-like domain-containing protein [Rathayibacter sp. VKM Ac-2801]QHC71592.1 cell wall anchor protein [Rathayibacter sp. VKM Ac-2801]